MTEGNAATVLSGVKSWMAFFGWTDGGSPGSVKKDSDGKIIATHGDAVWIKDVQECIERQERDSIRAELERRSALEASYTATPKPQDEKR